MNYYRQRNFAYTIFQIRFYLWVYWSVKFCAALYNYLDELRTLQSGNAKPIASNKKQNRIRSFMFQLLLIIFYKRYMYSRILANSKLGVFSVNGYFLFSYIRSELYVVAPHCNPFNQFHVIAPFIIIHFVVITII